MEIVREPLLASPSELDQLPDCPAVFVLRAGPGKPYLARTSLLRRRLKRLLGNSDRASRVLNLHGLVERIEYWPTGSQLESSLLFLDLARSNFPEDWQKITRLRPAAYVQLTLDNPFPRTRITSKAIGSRNFAFGPFLSRASAEHFEQEMLDLFQLRRCEENLAPSQSHPGCIYGEMNKCLRPCQQIVSIEEYRSEAGRVEQFLRTRGASLREPAESARDRASAQMHFEEALQMHERVERIRAVQALAGELPRALDQLTGVAVLPSSEPGAVELWFMVGGAWQPPCRFQPSALAGAGGSLDRHLRELAAQMHPQGDPNAEHLAILARWCGSSWRDGEWIAFDSLEKIPYRRLVNAVGRILTQQARDREKV
jgi:excinuclease UvrABC nuclease subunit